MIRFENITKNYGVVPVLKGLNLNVEENEIFGFIGATGTGKTTAMKILCGILSPTSGTCKVEGVDVTKHPKKIKPLIGYIPDFLGTYENLKVREFMSFFFSAYGLNGSWKEEKCHGILEMLGLCDVKEQFVEKLSRNQKKKLAIARALINEPKILLLDEPFSGVSEQDRGEFTEIVRQLNSFGVTIVMTVHTLREASGLCTSGATFEEGKVVMTGSIAELNKKLLNNNPLIMKIKEGQEVAIRILKEEERVKNLVISENEEILINFEGNQSEAGELLKKVVLGGGLVTSFARKGSGMESLI